MSKLVEQYLELGKKGFGVSSDDEIQNIRNEMAKLKKQFSESDWDELIASVPSYMKPMVIEQKKKFIK